MASIVVDWSLLEQWAQKINTRNDKLNDNLKNIQKTINGLQGDYESNAAVEIRNKINGMTPRFDQYYNVVKNYATFLHNTAETYKAAEGTLHNNASQFI